MLPKSTDTSGQASEDACFDASVSELPLAEGLSSEAQEEAERLLRLAISLLDGGDPGASIAHLNEALRLWPDFPLAHCKLGNALFRRGDLPGAREAYARALQLDPSCVDAFNNLGVVLRSQGDLNGAIHAYESAIAIKPDAANAHNNLAVALLESGRPLEAIATWKVALDCQPNDPEAHNNLAVALRKQGDLDAAIASYRTALSLKPEYPEALNNLANALREKGEITEAIVSYQASLILRPDHPETHFNLSLCLLLQGDYAQGWQHHGWRLVGEKPSVRPDAIPRSSPWEGEPLRPHQSLLLVSEQGLGDTLQFMRYALVLQAQGIPTSLCAHPPLHALIRASGIDKAPLTPQQANGLEDRPWFPLLSIPQVLEVSPLHPILTAPYIHPSQDRVAHWREILSRESGPVIGLHWQGNPAAEINELRGRSLPLELLAPLPACCDARLVSLQKGAGSEQLAGCSFRERFVSCQAQVDDSWDFAEVAAILANCDLIITSDSALAHLAGGMGLPTWLLLHRTPDWRWGLEGDHSFWYPSMRLFRQRQAGNWSEVIERLVCALQEHVHSV